MKAVDIKAIRYKDNLASQRRRRLITIAVLVLVGICAASAATIYALFYSPWFVIRDVSVTGLEQEHAAAVQTVIDHTLDKKIFGVPVGRNILFFKSGTLSTALTGQFSFLQAIAIEKKSLHAVVVSGTERTPEGVWCFEPAGAAPSCRYYDRDGVVWGNAVRSSGFLLLDVDDMRDRTDDQGVIDKLFLTAIEAVTAGLADAGIKVSRIVIPYGSFTEFDVTIAAGYPLRFSLDSDIPGQLTIFKIFKAKKIDTNEVSPQYLDLRFDGRVYFK